MIIVDKIKIPLVCDAKTVNMLLISEQKIKKVYSKILHTPWRKFRDPEGYIDPWLGNTDL